MSHTDEQVAPARLVSVNVGMPKDVQWQGKTVHTGIYKAPVEGQVWVRRLNIDGDGQGDLAGHGGEQRAVMVYQVESYDYWKKFLGRDDLVPGHFGENFTVSGLSDREVCIGDRYRIGEAEFEVTQPRVTCFRVGMRLGEPDMPNLLVSHRRPGFYLRVITEGPVQAGDRVVRTRRGRHELSVADVDALLYLPDRDEDRLRAAVDVPALSPGWRQSFRQLLDPVGSADHPPGWSGFRRLRVVATKRETPSVMSIELEPSDNDRLPAPLAGQYLTIRIPDAGNSASLRSYSLSGAPWVGRYRISVKRESRGTVSEWLHANIRAGSVIDAAAPRGDFQLSADAGPIVLISAGIGVTPLLSMLYALARVGDPRAIWWLHTTRDAESHAFAAEVTALIDALPQARQHIYYTSGDGREGHAVRGRLDHEVIAGLGLPTNASVYLCGPAVFMASTRRSLIAVGIAADRIRTELFGAASPINPGIIAPSSPSRPHPPAAAPGTGPAVTFARSGLTVNWSAAYRSVLELAEACDVPTRYSCRSGVCHTCATSLIEGSSTYLQPSLDMPATGDVLICITAPETDLILDM